MLLRQTEQLRSKGHEARRDRRRARRSNNRRRRRSLKKDRNAPGGDRKKDPPNCAIRCLADRLKPDLTIDVKSTRFYDSFENKRVDCISRLPLNYTRGYFKLGIYSDVSLTYVRSTKMAPCINKMSRFFGINPKKDRHWVALIRCLVCTGMNPGDLRSVMRIRDLKVRGKVRKYHAAISSFIARLPSVHRTRALTVSTRGGWSTW